MSKIEEYMRISNEIENLKKSQKELFGDGKQEVIDFFKKRIDDFEWIYKDDFVCTSTDMTYSEYEMCKLFYNNLHQLRLDPEKETSVFLHVGVVYLDLSFSNGEILCEFLKTHKVKGKLQATKLIEEYQNRIKRLESVIFYLED